MRFFLLSIEFDQSTQRESPLQWSEEMETGRENTLCSMCCWPNEMGFWGCAECIAASPSFYRWKCRNSQVVNMTKLIYNHRFSYRVATLTTIQMQFSGSHSTFRIATTDATKFPMHFHASTGYHLKAIQRYSFRLQPYLSPKRWARRWIEICQLD